MRRLPSFAPLLAALAVAGCSGGVADLADEPLGILVDAVENRGVDDADPTRREVIATFGHAGCVKIARDTTVTLNGAPGVVLEQGGTADDGTQNCLAPTVKVSFDALVKDDALPVDGHLVVEDGSGRVDVVITGLVAARGFTVDEAPLRATSGATLDLPWAPVGETPRAVAARFEDGADWHNLGGAPFSFADVPPADGVLVVSASWSAEASQCDGVRACDIATQHVETAPLLVE